MTERYDRLLMRRRLCHEALAGPLGYWERFEVVTTLDRIETEIAELDAPAFIGGQGGTGERLAPDEAAAQEL